jgi:hypothetical protein
MQSDDVLAQQLKKDTISIFFWLQPSVSICCAEINQAFPSHQ